MPNSSSTPLMPYDLSLGCTHPRIIATFFRPHFEDAINCEVQESDSRFMNFRFRTTTIKLWLILSPMTLTSALPSIRSCLLSLLLYIFLPWITSVPSLLRDASPCRILWAKSGSLHRHLPPRLLLRIVTSTSVVTSGSEIRSDRT
jgi:hypothetical protein